MAWMDRWMLFIQLQQRQFDKSGDLGLSLGLYKRSEKNQKLFIEIGSSYCVYSVLCGLNSIEYTQAPFKDYR